MLSDVSGHPLRLSEPLSQSEVAIRRKTDLFPVGALFNDNPVCLWSSSTEPDAGHPSLYYRERQRHNISDTLIV